VQEDTVVTFADMAKPLVMRSYLGWDNENQRYIAIGIDNDGVVGVDRLEILDDGSFVTMAESFHEDQLYFERYTSKIDGDVMSFSIDMIGTSGPGMSAVQGKMKRADKAAPMAMNASAFTTAPAAMIQQLGKTAGTFAVKATTIMMPGTPQMNITGTDVVKPLFDGTIVHVHTTGTAEGMPGQYVGELFYGYDAQHDCIKAVYLSNMGEGGEMTGTFTEDGKGFILTSALRYMGQPCVQRMIMQLDDNGAPTKAVGHTILGTTAPYESWNATYTKQ
jgi:hypothetical protein